MTRHNNHSRRKSAEWFALAEQGKVRQALVLIDNYIAKRPRDSLVYRERAYLHLYLGQTQQARADFDVVSRLDSQLHQTEPGKLHSDLEPNAIGVTYWMEGHRELALAFWRYTTRMQYLGRVHYSFQGAGIEAGQLLWFGAIHERKRDDVELVKKLYEKRLVSKRWQYSLDSWTGPIVHFFLGRIDDKALLDSAENDVARQCEAHFAIAIRSRELGRHVAYRKHLNLVAPEPNAKGIYDYYNTLPYFLGRFELGHRA